MKIIPAIDLLDGQCVRLTQGNYRDKTVYFSRPEEQIEALTNANADLIHLVDLSAAKDTDKKQTQLIRQLVNNTSIPVQVGGGIRHEEDVVTLLDSGVSQVVVGSLACKQPTLFKSLLEAFPKKIVLAVDVKVGEDGIYVYSDAWQTPTTDKLTDIIDKFIPFGLNSILCTDITRDGMLNGPNSALYQLLKSRYPQLKLQASGGIACLDDLRRLKSIGVDGVVIGKALYEKRFSLSQARKISEQEALC